MADKCSKCGTSIESGTLCGTCQMEKSLGEVQPPKKD